MSFLHIFCLIPYDKKSVMKKSSCAAGERFRSSSCPAIFQITRNPVGQILCCLNQADRIGLTWAWHTQWGNGQYWWGVIAAMPLGEEALFQTVIVLQFVWYFGNIWGKVLSYVKGCNTNLVMMSFQTSHGRTGEFYWTCAKGSVCLHVEEQGGTEVRNKPLGKGDCPKTNEGSAATIWDLLLSLNRKKSLRGLQLWLLGSVLSLIVCTLLVFQTTSQVWFLEEDLVAQVSPDLPSRSLAP